MMSVCFSMSRETGGSRTAPTSSEHPFGGFRRRPLFRRGRMQYAPTVSKKAVVLSRAYAIRPYNFGDVSTCLLSTA